MPTKNRPTSVRMDELRAEYGGVCSWCPSKDKLEFAHLRETGVSGKSRGSRQRYYDIRANPDAYTLLCQRCHKWLDQHVSRWKAAEVKHVAV